MTGAEHYERAEALMNGAEYEKRRSTAQVHPGAEGGSAPVNPPGSPVTIDSTGTWGLADRIAAAQVHATLALAAASMRGSDSQ